MKFDIVVVGGGHAGTEAAHIAARLGLSVGLITFSKDTIGEMSCNPSIGGLAKGHLVKEIDALGGLMARAADRSAIQYRVLNRSKGPAVRGTRVQADREVYRQVIQELLGGTPGIEILEDEVLGFRPCASGTDSDSRFIVSTASGGEIHTRSLVITAGTFLNGLLHHGFNTEPGGRAGDKASRFLSDGISACGHDLIRLKTGTPPRADGNTINTAVLDIQEGDKEFHPFSFFTPPEALPYLQQKPCYLTYTNKNTHEIIRRAIENNQAPLYSGAIKGVGPRYCPSIEDKIKNFGDRERHQMFIEPEGLGTSEVYLNGISSSLPGPIQDEYVRTIKGLEDIRITRYGYAVEYDAFDPRDLDHGLESRKCPGLYLAGQINGTSGYEEAAAQGLLAGLSAACSHKGLGRPGLSRTNSYIGVMVDDLVLKGIDEPYRMFTSRAEFRLLLREENAILRLGPIAVGLGCISGPEAAQVLEYGLAFKELEKTARETHVFPDKETRERFSALGLPVPARKTTLWELLKRTDIDSGIIRHLVSGDIDDRLAGELEIESKYEGYIERHLEEIASMKRDENLIIPEWLDFSAIPGVSREISSKLCRIRPGNISEMERIPGVTPAAVAIVFSIIKSGKKTGGAV